MAGFDITSRSITVGYKSLGGGLNSTASPLALEDNQASDCQNIDFDRFGSITKRSGYTQVNTVAANSGATWTSLYWYRNSTNPAFLVGTCGSKFFLWSAGVPSGSPTDRTGSVTITAGNNNLWQWTSAKDLMIGVNGVDSPIYHDGAQANNAQTFSTVTGLSTAKWTTSWQNYAFLARVTISGTIHPTRIYWSALNDPSTWDSADFSEINLRDGQAIMGLYPMGDRLVIFKEDSIWLGFYTQDADIPFVFQKTQSSVGAISGYSIQAADNGLIFQAQDGFYFFDGNNSIKLSDVINTTMDGMNKGRFGSSYGAYQKNKNLYWSTQTNGSGSTHDRVVTFNTYKNNRAFGIYTGITANAIATGTVSGVEYIWFGDYAGFVYRADNGLNDTPAGVTTAINSYWYSKWFDFGDPVNQHGAGHLFMYRNNTAGTVTFTTYFDLNETAAATDTEVISASSGGGLYRFDIDGRGHLHRYGFSNNTISESFRIHGFTLPVYLESPT